MFKIIDTINTICGENCASSRDQVYKPGNINVLVSVDHNSVAAHLARSDYEGVLRSACISNVVDGTDDDMLWNGSEGDGNVRSNV